MVQIFTPPSSHDSATFMRSVKHMTALSEWLPDRLFFMTECWDSLWS